MKEIKPLTGIRFFAAMWVVLFHFNEQMVALVPALTPIRCLTDYGHYAVPMFFILSGFILSLTYFDRYSIRGHHKFVWLRFARLWPMHAAVLVLLLLVPIRAAMKGGNAGDAYSLAALPSELAMVRCWWSDEYLWNYPAWSIHAEWFAYIFVFPVAFAAFHREAKRLVLIGSVVACVALHTAFTHVRVPGVCLDIIFLFLAGSALYRIRQLSPCIRGEWLVNAGAAFFVSALWWQWLFVPSFCLLIFGLSYERGLLARILSSKVAVYGGAISYSIYMTHALSHKLIAGVLTRFSFSGLTGVAVFVGILLVALAVAAMCHHFIEVPCNKWLRRHDPKGVRVKPVGASGTAPPSGASSPFTKRYPAGMRSGSLVL